MNKIGIFTIILGLFVCFQVVAQGDYWQQKVDYEMEISFDVSTHKYTGKQKLTYHNNSPDTLYRVFYHLYNNAFQPGSMMDVRSGTIADPDSRVGDRISKLAEDETGYVKVRSLLQDKQKVTFKEEETILSVTLAKPLLPGKSAVFDMEFEARAPIQIRRSGRNNKEGIDYSMSQWYPKLCEYDMMGWHANPYVTREFYGVWGDYDVKITIDSRYILGATGYLQNPEEVGSGYEEAGEILKPAGRMKTWHFKAPNVHDFVWAADPDYTHTTRKLNNGTIIHFLFQESNDTKNWKQLQDAVVKVFHYFNERYGEYPYKQFSVIQGGDRGMEYPMATLMLGERNLGGLLGTAIHEIAHEWYYGVLANNESLYAWMDEGFADYIAELAWHDLFEKSDSKKPFDSHYANYLLYARAAFEEPMSTHADHFRTNSHYSIGSYVKGVVFLHQLSYIVGNETFMKGMKRYFETWKFKHPTPNDFIRTMEKESGIELDWYKEYFVYTTKSADYGIESVVDNGAKTEVMLKRVGEMIMPIDLVIEKRDGSKELHNIPLVIMRGSKKQEDGEVGFHTAAPWPWTNPEYSITLPYAKKDIVSVTIDPSGRLADIDRENNTFTK